MAGLSHLADTPVPTNPEVFIKAPSALLDPEGTIVIPEGTDDVHYEAELVVGNVGAGSLSILRQSVPYVERVNNYYKARGGADLETIQEAKIRGPQVIRHRYRAVTVEDYEWLALRASGNVARARCLR